MLAHAHWLDSILVATVLLCAITDLARAKIYNVVVYPALLVGLAVNLSGNGPIDPGESLLGLFVGLAPMFLMYAAGGASGGDTKLVAVLGALRGGPYVGWTLVWGLLFGSIQGVLWTAWTGQLRGVLTRVGYTLVHSMSPGMGPTSHLDPKGPRIPFGIALCAGALVALAQALTGRPLVDL